MTAAPATLACVARLTSAAAYRLVGAGLVLAGIVGMNLAQKPGVSLTFPQSAGRGAIVHGFSPEMGRIAVDPFHLQCYNCFQTTALIVVFLNAPFVDRRSR